MDDHAGRVEHAAAATAARARASRSRARATRSASTAAPARSSARRSSITARAAATASACGASSSAASRSTDGKVAQAVHRGEGYAGRVVCGSALCRVCGGRRRTAAGEGGCSDGDGVSFRLEPGFRRWGTLCRWERQFVPRTLAEGVERNEMPVERGDRAVLAMAARQHACITSAQLVDAGLGRHAIAHRLGTGWLRRMFRGVYLVGPLEAEHSRAMAATLAVGERGLLSHYPAAVLWRLRPAAEGPIDVTVPDRKTRDRPGIRVHRSHLHPRDATRHHGIPVTSPARTLLDLAATATATRARPRGRTRPRCSGGSPLHSLNEQFSALPPPSRNRGTEQGAIRTDPALTRSEAERRMLELVRAARLPQPEANATRLRAGKWTSCGATRAPGGRSRRLRLPLIAPFVRAGPAKGCGADRSRRTESCASPGGRSPTSRQP